MTPRGYRILTTLHESSTTLVHRAERERDRRRVVLKILKQEAVTPGALARYRHEFEVLERLRLPGVVEILGIEMVHGSAMLVFEDCGASSLAKLRNMERFHLDQLLSLAVRIAETLGQLHDRGVAHGDINPSNILFEKGAGILEIADFGSSWQLSGEPSARSSAPGGEGTLPYMSPEQTGRMNRIVDHRTDFYSLGVTLYELFTGRLPFSSTDPVQLVHSHLARQPVPAHEIHPALPAVLSDIIAKLMAKMPEDRYQSARSCAHDLQECRRQLQAHGEIGRFPLGRGDHVERFEIASRLYGRDQQSAALREALARAHAGARVLALVAGHAGIGKSALVKELRASIADRHARFIEGKYDQYRRNEPYSGLSRALGQLVGQLLSEPEEHLAGWRRALHEALGTNGQVLVEVVPELAFLIGPQAEVPRLGPAETEHRFHLVFQRFLEVVCSAERPLVVFLDDLQWADSASLRWVRRIVAAPGVGHLLLIGAYRDSDVDATHPLTTAVDELRVEKASIAQVALLPLAIEHVRQLLADTLRRSPAECGPLAELVLAKTEGNPFFVNQFLHALHQSRLLVFDRSVRGWRWDMASIEALGITDDVVDFMLERIRELPEQTRRALELAACAGASFDIETLAVLCEDEPAALHGHLVPAVEMGLMQPLTEHLPRPGSERARSASYAFAHDRVQQAAYALIPGEARAATHLRVARLLERDLAADERERRIFEIAEHFDRGARLIEDADERVAVARLMLAAGRRAHLSLAHDTALRFLRTGLALLPADHWRSCYELTRDLTRAAMEAEHGNADFDAAWRLSDELLTQARDTLDQAAVHEFRIVVHIARNQPNQALELALEALPLLGIALPREPEVIAAQVDALREQLRLDADGFAALEQLPELADPHQAAAIRILGHASTVAFLTRPQLWKLMVMTTVSVCIRHGHSPLASLAYAWYGALLCGREQELDLGCRFGGLAVRLLERFPGANVAARVGTLFNVFVLPWHRPIREAVESLHTVAQRGLQGVDPEHALYAAINCTITRFFAGDPLADVHRQQCAYLQIIERHRLLFHRTFLSLWERTCYRLLGHAAQPEQAAAASDRQPDDATLAQWQAENHVLLLLCAYCCRAMERYIDGDYDAALKAAEQGMRYAAGGSGAMYLVEHMVQRSLAILACLPDAGERAPEMLAEVERHQTTLRGWAERVPETFAHKHALVEAERARAGGEALAAMAHYDAAIAGARAHAYLREEAVACERAASFYASLGRERIARAYLDDAYRAYRRWGAMAKIHALEARHPWLLGPAPEAAGSLATTVGSSTGSAQLIDVASVVRASQALSSQLVLDSLLAELMEIIIANAGAQRGYLLLVRDGALAIEAEGDIETGTYRALPSSPLAGHESRIAHTLVSYVARTGRSLVVHDAGHHELFAQDSYVRTHAPRSLLCAPITREAALVGIIYLENNLAADAFTPARAEVVQMLAAQAAISIDNALLLRTLELSKQEVERANRSLHAANQELERLLHSITHDLNEPLRAIRSFSDLVVRRYEDALDDQGRDYLARVVQANQRLGDLIEAMRVITKIRNATTSRQHVTGADLVQDALRRLAPVIAQTRAEVRVTADLPALAVDRHWAAEAVYQLVRNALQFARADQRPEIDIVPYQGAEGAGLRIQDRGVGVPAEDTDRLFELFRRAVAREVPGTGVGLAIVRQVAARHDGAAWLRPRAGGGTEACITFGR